jgi:DeoR/GlpR family transcriptional regulator of sugar metabolism
MGWTTKGFNAAPREHREIVNALMIFQQATLDDLSSSMGVKTKTMARWLDELRSAGAIIRVQGSQTSPPYYRLVGIKNGKNDG